MRLVNAADLADAYVGGRGSVAELDAYERRIVKLLLPDSHVVMPATARMRSAARPAWRWVRERRRQTYVPSSAERAIWFVVNHAKFLRFAAPIFSALGAENVGVVALAPEVTQAAVHAGIAVRTIDQSLVRFKPALRPRPHLGDLYAAIRDELEYANARSVVVFEGNAPADELTGAAARSLDIPSICVQHGWAAATNVGFRNMRHTALAAWGAGFAGLLAPYNPDQRFVVTGSPALASNVTTPVDLEHQGVLFSLQAVTPTIPRSTMESFVGFIAAAAELLPDVQMLVREHPGHPLSEIGMSIP